MILPWSLLAGTAKAATVYSVGDRDTIRVLDRPKRLTIRLTCIDAPNTAQAPSGLGSLYENSCRGWPRLVRW
jgi:endonuclease YncB( thermonuclease family)